MKTVQVTSRSTAKDVLPGDPSEEILVVRGGHAVALVMPFDDDDAEWYSRERSPQFIDSIQRAREQVSRGETVSEDDLDALFADTLDGLDLSNFSSPMSVGTLQRTKCAAVPNKPGVYVVLFPTQRRPAFLDKSVGGWLKKKNPSDPATFIRQNWIERATIVYIGKGDGKKGLQQRLCEFMNFGLGKAVGHRGGRLIWHLQNNRQLLVRWLVTPDENPAVVEKRMIATFRHKMGGRPFANLNG